jgi:hypothetical protein
MNDHSFDLAIKLYESVSVTMTSFFRNFLNYPL